MSGRKKVLIRGNFDLLNTGLIKYFEQASKFGDLYVCISKSYENQTDKLYVIKSIKYVHHVQISNGNIESDLETIKPDIFFLIPSNHAQTKHIVKQYGITYIVATHKQNKEKHYNELIPWRLCIAGAWLDQPFVSNVLYSFQKQIGSVIVMNVNYHNQFKHRSGLATSTRKTAIQLWENGILPQKLDNIKTARLLFGADNAPGTKYISGSQDHLGLLLPGINRLDYNGKYWPINIVSMNKEAKCRNKNINDIHKFIENVLWLVPIKLRPLGFDPVAIKHLTASNVEQLANASKKVWNAMLNCDVKNFGIGLTETLKCYKLILPNTVPNELDIIWRKYDKNNYGCSFSGAGGGGFLMVVSDHKPSENAYQIKINHKDWWKNKIMYQQGNDNTIVDNGCNLI
eukprot:26166_1